MNIVRYNNNNTIKIVDNRKEAYSLISNGGFILHRNTSLNIEENLIYEGTTIHNEANNAIYTVKKSHKRILIKGNNTKCYFKVVENQVSLSDLYMNFNQNITLCGTYKSQPAPFHGLSFFINTRYSRGKIVDVCSNKEELRALDTLRNIVSERVYRNYLKYGFINVKGQSGLIYQIYRDKAHTKVWKNGKLVEEICIRISKDTVPLTDNVIAFKTMIEADEEEFRKCGNVYKMEKKTA